jgi:lipopolysaccharide/colanic/teichoic acid biosynthesis glycosyltransferase
MLKRVFDIALSIIGIILFFPILLVVSFFIFFSDFSNPLYFGKRVGKNHKTFFLIKFRSMHINADKSGVESTSNNDLRITKVGSLIRKYKIDELPQFFNVFKGDMSFVGPRPQTEIGYSLYTDKEKKLLNVKPGITDFSSIVFSDEGHILKDSHNPDLDYNQLIRPWKSKLGLFYIKNRSIYLDSQLILLTIITIISKEKSLRIINKILTKLNADEDLIKVSKRKLPLVPCDIVNVL